MDRPDSLIVSDLALSQAAASECANKRFNDESSMLLFSVRCQVA